MNVNATGVYSNIASQAVSAYAKTDAKSKSQSTDTTAEASSSASQETAAASQEASVSEDKNAAYASQGVLYTPSSSTDRTAIISQLKSDLEARKESMINMVKEALGQQGSTYALASDGDDVWKLFADGNFTVSEAAKQEAQEAISEDGYWGVEQTSDRILEFAKALAGDDPEKADTLFEAFKEGYSQATSAWGKDLPDISQQTYDAVEKKFEEWKNSAAQPETETEG